MNRRILLKRCYLTGMALVGYVLLLPLWRHIRTQVRPEYRVLNYHSVGVVRPDDTNVTTMSFRIHCATLKQKGAIHDLDALLTQSEEAASSMNSGVAITFDDGYADNVHVACPILSEFGLSALFFVTAKHIGTTDILPHDRAYPAESCRLMTWDEVMSLVGCGMTIGSHCMTHVRLSTLDSEAQREQLSLSKEVIEKNAQCPVTTVSYPYGRAGDYGKDTIKLAQTAGYEVAFSARYGWNTLCSNRYELRRIGIDAADTRFTLLAKLNGALDLLVLMEQRWLRKLVRTFNTLFTS